MSVDTNAVVTIPVDLFVCRIHDCVLMCVRALSCILSVCVCMTMYLFYVCVSFSGPLSAPSGP